MSVTDLPYLMLIAVGLSADCFAVALSISIFRNDLSLKHALRTSLAFAVFQALMPLIGWLAGRTVVVYIASFDHWIVFVLLAAIGGKMICESFHSEGPPENTDISKWTLMLFLAFATSVDALAAGLTFAFLDIGILPACSIIGIIALLFSLVGFSLGRKVGPLAGKRAGTVGGVILIAIGLRVLITHLL